MRNHGPYLIGALLFGCAALMSRDGAAQMAVHIPIHGVTGIVAMPYNVNKFYTDVNKLLVEIGDHFGGTSEPQGIRESASLDTLHPGMPVVVQNTVGGIPASSTKATVTAVDTKVATIRLSDGATETLRFTSHGTKVTDGRVHHGNRVVVYSLDGSGYVNAHYFKP